MPKIESIAVFIGRGLVGIALLLIVLLAFPLVLLEMILTHRQLDKDQCGYE